MQNLWWVFYYIYDFYWVSRWENMFWRLNSHLFIGYWSQYSKITTSQLITISYIIELPTYLILVMTCHHIRLTIYYITISQYHNITIIITMIMIIIIIIKSPPPSSSSNHRHHIIIIIKSPPPSSSSSSWSSSSSSSSSLFMNNLWMFPSCFSPWNKKNNQEHHVDVGVEGLRTGKLLDRRFFWMGVLEHHGGRNGASRNFKIWEDMGCKFHLNIYIKTSYHYIIQNMH